MTTPALARRALTLACGLGAVLLPGLAQAGSTHPFEDGLANVLSWVALTVMPVLAVYLFWKIHVLPEVIAHKRNHPQVEAIRVLCLLSLAFGGLLWPLAWLWAYMKPIEVPIVRSRKRRDQEHEQEPEQQHGHASVDGQGNGVTVDKQRGSDA
jgi:hypothetical protein